MNTLSTTLTDPFYAWGTIFDKIHSRESKRLWTESYPPYDIIDIRESNSLDSSPHFVIRMALAGFHKRDIKITRESNVVTISGKKKDINPKEETFKFLHKGIANREFEKSFTLNSDIEISDAVMEDGVLYMYLSKTEPVEKEYIQIK